MKIIKEEEIEQELKQEFKKRHTDLAKDIIREANTLPEEPAGENENLDIIKHLIKRLAVHQLIIEEQAKIANARLVVLSIIMAIGAIFTILGFFY